MQAVGFYSSFSVQKSSMEKKNPQYMVGFIADFLLERWSCYKTGLHAVESSKYFLKLVLRDQSEGAVLFPFDH